MNKIHVGSKYGRLTVTAYRGCRNGKTPMWECTCDCGMIVNILGHHLRNDTKSCGCLKRELLQGSTKVCADCNNLLPIDNFHKNGAKTNTRKNRCKQCNSLLQTALRIKRNKQVKLAAITHYSNGSIECSCCQERHYEFLTIDHIGGGGTKHRKTLPKSSGAIFRWLRNNNYPVGFRVLCINCNFSRGIYGYCPHHPEMI